MVLSPPMQLFVLVATVGLTHGLGCTGARGLRLASYSARHAGLPLSSRLRASPRCMSAADGGAAGASAGVSGASAGASAGASDPLGGAALPAPEDLSDEALKRIVLSETTDAEVNELVWKYLGYVRAADGSWDASGVFPNWAARFPSPPDLVGVTRTYTREVDEPVLRAVQSLQKSVPR